MKNSLISIARGILPEVLSMLYADIHLCAKELGIDYLVVGANARDLVLHHGFGAEIVRGTTDVDFAISVQSWESFQDLKNRLLSTGYMEDTKNSHRVKSISSGMEIDIVPFGGIADKDAIIYWPPKRDRKMSVLGFREALDNCWKVQTSEVPELIIPVASPAGICILKLVAWLDREVEKRLKDADDFLYLIKNYSKIPEIFDALYDEGCMEEQGFDEEKASAMKLGKDVRQIILPETKDFVNERLFFNHKEIEQFARAMSRAGYDSPAECGEWLAIFKEELNAGS